MALLSLSVATWRQIQAISGLVFATFLVLHLVSLYCNMVSQEAGKDAMRTTRHIYQNILYEPACVFGSLILHMVSGGAVIWNRRRVASTVAAAAAATAVTKKTDGDPADDHRTTTTSTAASSSSIPAELTAHRYAGYLLSLLVFGHAYDTRIAPILAFGSPQQARNVLTDYSHVYLATIDFGPAYVIYYILLGMAGTWHLIYGTRAALMILFRNGYGGTTTTPGGGKQPSFPLPLKVVALMGHILIINAVLAISGWHHYDVTVTSHDHDVHEKISKVMGL